MTPRPPSIVEQVAALPPLSPEARAQISLLLRTGTTSTEQARRRSA